MQSMGMPHRGEMDWDVGSTIQALQKVREQIQQHDADVTTVVWAWISMVILLLFMGNISKVPPTMHIFTDILTKHKMFLA